MCGGPSGASKSIPPALSLYCLHRGGEGVENSTNVDWALALYGSNSVLSHVRDTWIDIFFLILMRHSVMGQVQFMARC